MLSCRSLVMPVYFFTGLLLNSSLVFAFTTVKFSDVQQCGPFAISFAGGMPPTALPLILTVLPLQSSPISIVISDSSWNQTMSSGAAVAHLPFAAGTSFIASLDDAEGQGVGPVSDVMKILPSNNNSCVTTTPISQQYTIRSVLTQCHPFDVVYNATTHSSPSVRAFRPLGPSYLLNQTQSNNTATLPPFQVASYQMTATQGSQIALLFSDKSGYRESSSLISVLDGTPSNTSCLSFFTGYGTGAVSQQAPPTSGLSGKVVVAITATIVGVLVLVLAVVGIYAYRHGWYRWGLKMRGIEGGPGFNHSKGFDLTPPFPPAKIATTYSSDILSSIPTEKYHSRLVHSRPIVLSPRLFNSHPFASNLTERMFDQPTTSWQSSVPTTKQSSERPRLTTLDETSLRNRESVTMSDIEQMLDVSPMHSPSVTARESKLPNPESPGVPHSPYPFSVAPLTMRTRNADSSAFPVSPMPSVSNFGTSWTTQELHSQSGANQMGEILFQRTWDEVDPEESRKSGGTYASVGNTTLQIPEFFDRAKTGVGRGRGLSNGGR